ncbi:glycosyltransferase family 9 protein [Vibrio splendidus]|uniref:glycosyltransferase family 9 protein n=1 Tax=Vibrio splendidus TaxID=29497 RepID=UPI0009765F57|nr:glycosyltransferase family 9 protein [Vibrio splendidus]OMO27744.1 hypothetical protein BH581_02440 [Vibrio splendidus]PMH10172.1 hypothetical protein BCU75_11040 [Vibrio splendidus]PMI85052.1 hypothetical protein BCU37_10715 [Vibrio splendidus]PMK11848.1 hypothetical protein BCU10_02420 [Vibrio splendidus]PMK60391.1 hypothetical protein BCT96_11240 [Vibrio splendidus]
MKKIAIFTPGRRRFGSVVLQLPLISALRDYYGECQITVWTVNEPATWLCVNNGADDVIEYKDMSIPSLLKQINSRNYDVLVNLRRNSSKLHHLIMPFVNAKEKFSHSTQNLNARAYDYHALIPKKDRYIANAHLQALNGAKNTNYQTSIIDTIAEGHDIDNFKNALVLLPGGGAGSFKRWPIQRFIDSAESILQSNQQLDVVYIVLGPQEQEYNDVLPSSFNGVPVVVFNSPSIEQLVAMARKTKLTIANDCGPAHIFQMMQNPLVMMFGWGSNNLKKMPQEVIKEWFLFTDRSLPLLPSDPSGSIESISTDKVIACGNAMLNLQ